MKSRNFIGMILFILAIATVVGCKKKEVVEPVIEEPEIEEVVMRTEAEFLKNDIFDLARNLEPGETVTRYVPDDVESDQYYFEISLFPLEFISPAEKPYVEKYLFPSVVVLFESGTRLDYFNLPEYLDNWEEGDVVHILKESGVSNIVYEHVPTVLVQGSVEGYFKILEDDGDEMPLRSEWPESLR